MYAIVEIAGQQFKVAKDQKVYVHRLKEAEGSKITFDKVMLVEDGKNVTIGAPAIEGAAVTAKILGHLKGDKVIVFKKKRRKGYKKKNGHRQFLSEIQIESIAASGAKKAPAKKAAAPKKEETAPESEEEVPDEMGRVFEEAPDQVDDLKKISGVGPGIEEKLNGFGVYTYAQIAEWNDANIVTFDKLLSFKGRIERDNWLTQAKELEAAKG